MLASIHPLGERGRNNRWAMTVSAYLLGTTLGGALAGAAFGGLGSLVGLVWRLTPTSAAVAVAGVCAAGVALDTGIGGLRVPSSRRQVNENWLTAYRGWVYGLGFGVQLGLGVVTVVTTAAELATFAVAFVTQDVWLGATVGLVFGIARGATIFTVAGVRDADGLRRVHRRLQEIAPGVRSAAVGVQALTAVGALGLFLLSAGGA